MSLLEKMKKAGSIKTAEVLAHSPYFNAKDLVTTEVPIINVAFSADPTGGLVPGLTVLAGESKSFKTLLMLLCMKAYLETYPESIALLYDSEFGITPEYLKNNGIDTTRVLHIPIVHIEELKFDIAKRLDVIEKGDKIFFGIDSVGALASKKEAEDALDAKSVADMSRAKALKSLFRIIGPQFTMKDIPCVAINHVYKELALYPKTIVGGGCLIAGSKIKMADNTIKNIEDVRLGDIVKTLYGDQPVTAVWDPETLADGEPECYEIEFEDGSVVVCSDEHKFLIDGIWIEAKDLTEGMVCTTLN